MVPKKRESTSGQPSRELPEPGATSAAEKAAKLSDVIDPVFEYLEIRIPEKIEKIFKGVAEIRFIYSITADSCMEIVDLRDGKSLLRVLVAEFDAFDFAEPPITDIIFIFNRERCKAMVKEELNKKYKESLGTGAKFVGHDYFSLIRKRYLEYQLDHGTNFVFISDSLCLHAHIRSMASLLRKRDEYTPKVKKSDAREECLKSLLMAIPGVNENVVQAIISRYGTFESLQNGLKDKGFCSLKVPGTAGGYRRIPDRVHRRLVSTFLSEDPGERIQ